MIYAKSVHDITSNRQDLDPDGISHIALPIFRKYFFTRVSSITRNRIFDRCGC